MEKFNPPEFQEGNNFTLEPMCLESSTIPPVVLPTKKEFIMPNGFHSDKKRGKLEFSKSSTQKSLKISEVDSKSKEKLHPFWNKSNQKMSKKKILSFTKNDYEKLVSDCSNSDLDSLK